MRLLWVGMSVVVLLHGLPTEANACTNDYSGASYERPLYNNELTVALPQDWRLVKSDPQGILKYDNVIYYVQRGSHRVFMIDLTNDGNFPFPDNTTSANVMNNGIWATEYRLNNILTSVVVKPPCGGFRYVWMRPITKNPGERRQVEASMKSIKCVGSPRPGP